MAKRINQNEYDFDEDDAEQKVSQYGTPSPQKPTLA